MRWGFFLRAWMVVVKGMKYERSRISRSSCRNAQIIRTNWTISHSKKNPWSFISCLRIVFSPTFIRVHYVRLGRGSIFAYYKLHPEDHRDMLRWTVALRGHVNVLRVLITGVLRLFISWVPEEKHWDPEHRRVYIYPWRVWQYLERCALISTHQPLFRWASFLDIHTHQTHQTQQPPYTHVLIPCINHPSNPIKPDPFSLNSSTLSSRCITSALRQSSQMSNYSSACKSSLKAIALIPFISHWRPLDIEFNRNAYVFLIDMAFSQPVLHGFRSKVWPVLICVCRLAAQSGADGSPFHMVHSRQRGLLQSQ